MRNTTVLTETINRTVVTRTCDLCGNDPDKVYRYKPFRHCAFCKRDMCGNCGLHWTIDPFDGGDTGDYPPEVCVECDASARELSAVIRPLKIQYDEAVENWERSRTPSPTGAGKDAEEVSET